jgi:hypothetical protein
MSLSRSGRAESSLRAASAASSNRWRSNSSIYSKLRMIYLVWSLSSDIESNPRRVRLPVRVSCSAMRPALSCGVRLRISCPHKKALISAISPFMAMHDGSILSADQYVSDSRRFFMRLKLEGAGFGLERDEFSAAFAAGPLVCVGLECFPHRRAQKDGDPRIALPSLPHRPAMVLGRVRARSRVTARHLEPLGARLKGGDLRHPAPPPAGHQRD